MNHVPGATENSRDKSETLIKDIYSDSNTDMNEGKHGLSGCILFHKTSLAPQQYISSRKLCGPH